MYSNWQKIVVPWGLFSTSEGVLILSQSIIDQWCGFIDLGIFGLALTICLQNDHSQLRKQYKAVSIVLHCAMFSIIALIKFNVSSLHLSRKGQLKLIIVRIWFWEWSFQSYSRLPLTLCIIHLGLTHVLSHYTV